jgi:hypothetical protein
MGFGLENFPKTKVPGRTNFSGGSIGLCYNSISNRVNIYINKNRIYDVTLENVTNLGFGISKLTREVFLTCNGKLQKVEKIKYLGKLFPILNLGTECKVEVFFEEYVSEF